MAQPMNRIKYSMTPRETSKRVRSQILQYQIDLQTYWFPSSSKVHGSHDLTNINDGIKDHSCLNSQVLRAGLGMGRERHARPNWKCLNKQRKKPRNLNIFRIIPCFLGNYKVGTIISSSLKGVFRENKAK